MLYDGKRPQEMTGEELDAAALYLVTKRDEAQRMVQLNDAGLAELVDEYERRLRLKGMN